MEQAARYGRTGSPFAPGEVPLSLAGLAAVPEGLSTRISDGMAVARALADQSGSATRRWSGWSSAPTAASSRWNSCAPPTTPRWTPRRCATCATRPRPCPRPPRRRWPAARYVASTWEFSLVVSITPPLPMIAVQFDEVLGLVDVRVPLDRRLFKLVRLVSVE